jgi:hypothetical protein
MATREYVPRVIRVKTSRDRVRLLAVLGFAVALLFLIVFSKDPTGTLTGGHTDHVAHVGETRGVTAVGITLWRQPAVTLFRRLTTDELTLQSADLREYAVEHASDIHYVASFAPDRPLVMNFAHLPRCYPPGVFLVALPSAFALHVGWLSFSNANRLFLALLALFWLVGVFAWTAHWDASISRRWSVLRELLTVGIAAYVWYWAMEGFYDVAAVALASWAQMMASDRRRFGVSTLLWGLAAIVHSRMLALLPLALLPSLGALLQWKWQSNRGRAAWLVGAALLLGALCFAVWIQPTVALHAASAASFKNVLRPNGGGPLWVVLAYGVLLLYLTRRLWSTHARVDAATVLFMGLAFASQRYLVSWYWLLALPWAFTAPLSIANFGVANFGLANFWPRAHASVQGNVDAIGSTKAASAVMSSTQVIARSMVVLVFYLACQAARGW